MNKIGWCDITWNPVWGCLNNCEYCYAWGINRRFWAKMLEIERNYHFKKHQSWAWTGDQLRGLHDFRPTFLDAQFDKKFPQKTQKIFVGSMSEIAHWEKRWMEVVLDKILCYPQHIFQFLTKFPEVYQKYNFPDNCWLGVTITKEGDFSQAIPYELIEGDNIFYLSLEPLLEYIDPSLFRFMNIDWIIIGFQTNPFKKIKKEAVIDIIEHTRKNNIPLFLKDSIYKGYPDLPIIKEFPNGRTYLSKVMEKNK